jgi:hypothetical protein
VSSRCFSTRHQRFTRVRLPDPYLTRSSAPFASPFTTLALDQRSVRWFGAWSCTPTPRGRPSSLPQHCLPSRFGIRGTPWSRHSLLADRIHRSARAFARGALTGVRIRVMPSRCTRRSNSIPNRPSRSRIRYCGGSRSQPHAATICWAAQSAVGCRVTRTCRSCRVSWCITKKTSSVRKNIVRTQKKSHAQMSVAWRVKNSRQLGDGTPS